LRGRDVITADHEIANFIESNRRSVIERLHG
jgi:hypothetical protein